MESTYQQAFDRSSQLGPESAEEFRDLSGATGVRWPSTLCHAWDVDHPSHRATGASSYGWRECYIQGVDPIPGTWAQPSQVFALFDPGLAAVLREYVGERWDAISCAEPKAVNNLLLAYPGTELNRIAINVFWVSDGSRADPCDQACSKWVYTVLHSVNGRLRSTVSHSGGDFRTTLGPLSPNPWVGDL